MTSSHEALDARIAYHAKAYKLPESLVHAVVRRERKYNPSLKHGPFWGLMRIRHDTARSMGYMAPPTGLLDPETNLTYAVAYLANAFRVAQGDAQRAIRLYANGYYYEAKRQGLLGEMRTANHSGEIEAASDETARQVKSAAELAGASFVQRLRNTTFVPVAYGGHEVAGFRRFEKEVGRKF